MVNDKKAIRLYAQNLVGTRARDCEAQGAHSHDLQPILGMKITSLDEIKNGHIIVI